MMNHRAYEKTPPLYVKNTPIRTDLFVFFCLQKKFRKFYNFQQRYKRSRNVDITLTALYIFALPPLPSVRVMFPQGLGYLIDSIVGG